MTPSSNEPIDVGGVVVVYSVDALRNFIHRLIMSHQCLPDGSESAEISTSSFTGSCNK